MTIVLASTIAPHKLDEGYALKWLEHYEAMFDDLQDHNGQDLAVFVAAEVDSRGITPYFDAGVYDGWLQWNVEIWTFSLNQAPESSEPFEVTTQNRLIRICTGRNLAIEYAINVGATHILYVDSDTEPTPDCLSRLLEVKRPIVFGHVPTYNLDGPQALLLPGDCRHHWSSAGFCLVSREVFRRVRWGHDPDDGKTDDPTFARDVELMGRALERDWSPITRHDVVGTHWPQSIYPLEQRPVDRFLR